MKALLLSTHNLPQLEALRVGYFYVIYLDYNNINATGFILMSNTKFLQLKLLYLRIFIYFLDWNNVGSRGVKSLIKAELPLL